MARRAQPVKRSKPATGNAGKSKSRKSAPKRKSGGIGRLMLGGAVVAGAVSAFIAAGSMMELDRASRDLGEAGHAASNHYSDPLPKPEPQSRNYDFSANGGSGRDRTGYLVGQRYADEEPLAEGLNEPDIPQPPQRPQSSAQVSPQVSPQAPANAPRNQNAALAPQRPQSAIPAPQGGNGGNDAGIAANGAIIGQGRDDMPPWQRYAALAPQSGNAPVIAIVIDDAGLDQHRTAKTIELPGPVTISYLPYARDLSRQVSDARARGHEIMLHMPMEPSSPRIDPGPHALLTSFDTARIRDEITWMLDRFDGYVGVNNHMGSKFTADPQRMDIVMQVMKERGLLFLDSRTSAKSVGYSLAQQHTVPALTRDVFIDDADDAGKIAEMLAKTEKVASHQGFAIAIGHPRDLTLQALHKWIPEIRNRGFVLVPLTDVLHRAHPSATG